MKSKEKKIDELHLKCRELRIKILDAIYTAGKGHIGGSYSIVEILVSLYHGGILKFDSKNPKWHERDRFILSKGHAAIAHYVTLADLEFFPGEELSYFNQGNLLKEHPDPSIPGIEVISGSLGHGLSLGAGMALADKFDNKNSRKSIILLGDGECHEGSVWEAANFAAHHKLNNLWAIIDRNKLITHGSTETINKLEPLKAKWDAFGWETFEVNAHDIIGLLNIWQLVNDSKSDKPKAIIANSTKGKGISFMENNATWHHGGISEETYNQAIKELSR